jgi:endogenous inhibitor of DNA gyrase (YacG/DUF329 family)
MPSISQVIPIAAALEWAIWFLLRRYVRDIPKCPLCKKDFQWREIDTYNERGKREVRRTSFPCPECQQVIGVPSWRRSFLRGAGVAFYMGFLFVFFELLPAESPRHLMLGILGAGLLSFGVMRIGDWFIWRELQPGTPSQLT